MTFTTDCNNRPLRADAEINRAKILAAAAQVFAERGLDGTVDEVADVAGVGVGTVYRRFRDKDGLVAALFDDAIDDVVNLALTASSRGTSWEALVWFLEQALEMQCANRGLRDVVIGSTYAEHNLEAAKCRIIPAIAILVKNAQDDGFLRTDVVVDDFPILEMMVSFLGNLTAPVAPDLWRRYLSIILDGLAVSRSAPSPLTKIPADLMMSDAMRDLHRRAKRAV